MFFFGGVFFLYLLKCIIHIIVINSGGSSSSISSNRSGILLIFIVLFSTRKSPGKAKAAHMNCFLTMIYNTASNLTIQKEKKRAYYSNWIIIHVLLDRQKLTLFSTTKHGLISRALISSFRGTDQRSTPFRAFSPMALLN